MRPETLRRARQEAEKFVALAKAIKVTKSEPYGHEFITSGPKETGALRRASMELTRALAELRRP